jgi:glycolate oxidase iron-sulfur subunit
MAISGRMTATSSAPAAGNRPPGAGATPSGPTDAALVALADRCVQCGLCLPHCPTYGLDASESESPRGRIAYVRATASGALAPTPVGDLHLDHCLGCLRCQGACPAGVDYAGLLVEARAAQVARVPLAPSARRWLGLLSTPWLGALLRGYRLAFPLLPARWRLLPRPPGAGRGVESPPSNSAAAPAVALFEGCVSATYEMGSRRSLARLLAAAGVPTVTPRGQRCCGAAAAHAGDAADAAALAAENRAAFAGARRVLCLASGCRATLASSLSGVAPVDDALVALAERAEALQFRDAGGLRVALHLPCTQWGSPGSVGATRRLLARVPGLDVVELADTGCCGAAGLHMLAFPARAAALRAPLLAEFARSGATQLLSANIGCRLHLAGALEATVRHPVDLLGDWLVEAPVHAPAPVPTGSRE